MIVDGTISSGIFTVITPDLLAEHFYPVLELGDGLVRCDDELPKTIFHTYFLLGQTAAIVPFLTSENLLDDAFAAQVLATVNGTKPKSLTKIAIGQNGYSFTHVLHVAPEFHSELKGRLDEDRKDCVLCIPIFESEFSSSETVDEFVAMRRRLVATQDWVRRPAPKIMLRFDNPKTKGGTTGAGYVPAGFDQIFQEIAAMVGVQDGFIEILNFRGEVIELVFEQGQSFRIIQGRDDAAARLFSIPDLEGALRAFAE